MQTNVREACEGRRTSSFHVHPDLPCISHGHAYETVGAAQADMQVSVAADVGPPVRIAPAARAQPTHLDIRRIRCAESSDDEAQHGVRLGARRSRGSPGDEQPGGRQVSGRHIGGRNGRR